MKNRTWKSLRNRAVRGLSALTIVMALFAAFGPQTVLAASTINVNTTADENGTGTGCSLREAITTANTNANFGGCTGAAGAPFTINVPAGTYELTLANAGGVNEDNNATGDLDVLQSLTIQGAGAGTTIIEAGTNTSNGIDKVLALNPKCTSSINVTIDGVTIRFGRNSQPSGAPDFSFTGGGIDWCDTGSGGTFTLSNSVVSDNTNVNGYGGGLNVDTVSSPTTVNITNVTFSNNQTLSTTQTANGGAINLFGDSPTINITNSTFTGNHTTNPTSGGGAIYFRPTTVGHLTISGSTFTTNTAAGIGGALATDAHGAGTTVTIGTSTFTGNTATNSFGGALDLDATNLNTTPFSLTHLTITGNSAGQAGGGINVGNSNVTMSKSLIVGNSAPNGSGLHKSVDAATATVTNNWWGCSTGPSASPCDTASTAGGTLTLSPWYRDQLTAGTSPIATNQSTSLTASFLTNSANTAVPVADLAEIIGRSVTWAATNGNLSSTQGTVQAAGTATGSFQATAAGTAIISAKVDNDNTAPVSSNVLSLTVNKADTTAAITNGTTLSTTPSVTGQPVTVNFSVTGAFGNSPTAPTGNVTVSDGTDSCTGTVAAGTCNLTFKTAGAKTLTATYGGDTNFNASAASTSASHTVNKADTTTAITSDTPDPSVTGQTVTFNVSAAAVAPGAAVSPTTITGSVTVSDGGTNTCIATLTAGAGSCTIAFPSAGSFSMTGTYGGDANFNGSTSATNSHTVNPADTTTTITSDNPDPSNVGQAVTVNFSVTANSPGAGTPTGNVTVTDGSPATCTGTVASGTCSITLTTPGARTLTATYAGDSNFNGSSGSAPHGVNQAPAITSANSTTFTVGTAGSFSVTTTGFPTPTISETGALPSGVTFTDNGDGTATLSGTPAAGSGGVYNLTIKASNGVSPDATQNFTLTVNEAPAFTSANHTTFTVGSAGSFSVTTSGFPTPALSESGTLPNGVTFSDNGNGTATLSGTPAAGTAGTYNLAFTAHNTSGSDATQNFTLTVNEAPTITSADHATFTEGQSGSFNFTTTGFPTSSLSESGALPSGVTFVDNGDGTATLSGTPAAGSAGTYNLTITANNGVGSNATQNFTLTVNPPLAITSADHTTFTVGMAGSFTVTTIGTPTPTVTESGALPSGVTFTDNGNGTATLAGTPAAGTGGTYSLTITAHNGVAPDAVQNFTLTVNEAPAITNANSVTFTVGTAGSFNATSTGFPKPSLSESGALPGGVNFTDNGDGTATLSGTPAVGSGGVYNLTITASNGVGSNATQNFTLTVNQAPAITSDNTTTFTVGMAGSFSVTSTGFPKPSLSESGSLPSGVTFVDNGNGTATLSGTPAAGTGGVYNITITASNGVGSNATQNFTLTVNQEAAITSANTTTFTETYAGSFTVTATGFPVVTISESGALPSGVTFVDNGNGTATLSGTPPVGSAGSYPLTITAHNGIGSDATQSFTLVVNPANHPPTATVTNGQCSTMSMASGTINLTLADADSDPVTLVLASNSNKNLVPNNSIVIGGSGYNRTISVTGASKKSGTATLTFNLSDGKVTVPIVVTVIIGTGKGQTLNGTNGIDMIFGMNGTNTINGNDGNDLLCGGNSVDTINGGNGNDIIDGENGNDILNGNDGNDILRGNLGNDTLTGGAGADFFSGGMGTDVATDFNPAEGDTQDGTIP